MKILHAFLLVLFLWAASYDSQAQIRMIAKKLHGATSTSLTEEEAAQGIREALQLGIDTAVALVSKTNGYFGNPEIRIPFPEDVRTVESKLRGLGMGNLVDEGVLAMNRAAEEAAKQAIPIFTDAITNMSLNDAISIVKGSDNAATQYLARTSSQALRDAFSPVIKEALDHVNATQAWELIMTTYNQIPFVSKQNTDLSAYVTEKAIDGLFIMIAKEESKIRQDPAQRVTDLLKQVFGN